MSNREHVKSIAHDINTISDGNMFVCPCCGRYTPYGYATVKECDDEVYCPECDEPMEMVTWYDYFNDILNIEYRAPSKHDDINSVSVCIAWGGPSIYIDTADNKVKLYWWGDYAECEFNRGAADEITDYFNELWNCE